MCMSSAITQGLIQNVLKQVVAGARKETGKRPEAGGDRQSLASPATMEKMRQERIRKIQKRRVKSGGFDTSFSSGRTRSGRGGGNRSFLEGGQ